MLKEKLRRIVDELPDDVDVDAFVDRLYLLRKIELAEEQLARGEGVTHDEAKQRLAKWLD